MKNILLLVWQKYITYSFMVILILFIIVALWLSCVIISDKNAFYATTFGAFLAFLLALVVYRISLFLDNKTKDKANKENTRYVYELYKIELQQNISHIDDLIEKKWLPYYRLKSITRDKLWGELADYSKDLDLMKKLNAVYGEFELINNKIQIINEARLAKLNVRGHIAAERVLNDEIKNQLAECISLSKNAKRMANECLNKIDIKISNIR